MNDKDKELALELYDIVEEMLRIAAAAGTCAMARQANRAHLLTWMAKLDED